MADHISLDDLPSPLDPTRRDRWGRYLVVPPGETEAVGYTRVTTIAKSLDSAGGLAPWKAAMTASGIIMRRGLRAQWEALIAQTGDPWYHGEESKRTAKRLVEECAAIGGANDRKEVGTALHALTAMVDSGQTPQHLTVETERDLKAYTDGLAAAGISIIPGAIELSIVLDSVQVAGTFDRLAVVPGFELPLVADLKTGSNLGFSWNSIAVQLAAYAHGEAIYKQGPAKDGSQDVRRPMPDVDQSYGLVMALDASADTPLELWLVDLQAGWDAFEHSLWAREWRKQRPARSLDDVTPLPPDPEKLVEQLQVSVASTRKRRGKTVSSYASRGQRTADPTQTAEDVSIDAYHDSDHLVSDYRDWLQHRIDTIGQDAGARQTLIVTWPSDVPTLRSAGIHTLDQLQTIEVLLDNIERQHGIVFPSARPPLNADDEAVANVIQIFPGTTTVATKEH